MNASYSFVTTEAVGEELCCFEWYCCALSANSQGICMQLVETAANVVVN